MTTPRLRPASGRSTRSAALAGCGLLIAVLAEASSVGLLALSGWFIAACAAAGASASSTFSYLAPSGGVRAFAVARIAGNYGKRIVLHAAALRRVAAARVRFYDTVAAASSPPGSSAWSGELLDKAMVEAETAGMSLIRGTAPVLVTGVLTVAASGFIAVAGFPISALVLLAGVAGCALIAHRTPPSARESRTALRAEVVTAVDVWAEMASLGAADRLAERITDRLHGLDREQRSATAGTARRTLFMGFLTVLTVAGVLLAMFAQSRTPDALALVLMALLTTGVLTNADQLASAADARRDAHRAREQLRLDRRPTTLAPAVRVSLTAQRFGFADYVLPEMVLRRQRSITADVPRGGTLVVTGRSGSGKTTLLQAITTAVASIGVDGEPERRLVTSVWSDDYLFTGTVGANLRLAQPDLDDSAATALLADMWLDRSGVSPATPTGVAGRDLSGGEQRRIHIARAVTTAPHVLVIDEPTYGLDEDTAGQVLCALRRRLPDTTFVLAMHHAPAYLACDDDTTIVSLD